MFELLFLVHVAALIVVNVKDDPQDGSKFSKAYPWIKYAAGLFTDKVR